MKVRSVECGVRNSGAGVQHSNWRTGGARGVRCISCRVLGLVLVLSGCATKQPVGVVRSGPPPTTQVTPLGPGPIAVKPADSPALLGLDQADGKMGHVGTQVGDTAAKFLNPPHLGDPAIEAAWSVAGTALAPFAAAVTVINAAGARLPHEKLAQAQTELAKTMSMMADQRRFRDSVLKAGNERSPGSLVSADSLVQAEAEAGAAAALLETKVEEMRLVRVRKGESSFALRVKARARLLRPDDCAVLYDCPVEYQSGTALYIDWTYPEAFRGVVETAYRELAAQVAHRLLPANPEGPVLVGAGYKGVPAPKTADCVPVLARQTVQPRLIRVANAPADYQGAIGVFSTASGAPVAMPRPLTRDQAVPAAIERTQWALDGLQDSRNLPVQLAACATAIPISLWHQAVIGITCPSAGKVALAEAQLSRVTREVPPQTELACAVARHLAERTSQPVVLVEGTLPAADGSEAERVSAGSSEPAVAPVFATASGSRARMTLCGLHGMRVGAVDRLAAEDYVLGAGPDTALEIQVLSAALRGTDHANPALAMCVEARARLLRVSDGQELFSGLLNYRGHKHKFTVWGAHDARLFRQEMERCYQELSRAAVDQLATRQLIVPGVRPPPTLVAGAEK